MANRILKGIVVSDKMMKTMVIKVNRYKQHPVYKKFYKVGKNYKAHVENGGYQIGDKVLIQECNPISKDKKWIIIGRQ